MNNPRVVAGSRPACVSRGVHTTKKRATALSNRRPTFASLSTFYFLLSTSLLPASEDVPSDICIRRSVRADVTLPKLVFVCTPVVGLNVAVVFTSWNCT